VSACPDEAVKYGLTRPPILRRWFSTRVIRPPFEFTWREEALMAAVFLATLFVFRGLYDAIPFLLTLGLGGILAYAAVLALRLVTRRDLRLNNFTLKRAGRLTRGGALFAAGGCAFAIFATHSAYIRYHEFRGHRAYDRVQKTIRDGVASTQPPSELHAALNDLETCYDFGLLHPPRLRQRLAALHAGLGEHLAERGDLKAAATHLGRSVGLAGDIARTRFNLGVMLAALGRDREAAYQYQHAAALDPSDPDIHNNLGLALVRIGQAPAAERCFREALARRPQHAAAHFNLGRLPIISAAPESRAEAAAHLRAAAQSDARYAGAVQELLP
jgi:hypothetical protein